MKSPDGIEKYLKALAHRVRRDIIRALYQYKHLSYSELMKITGVEDSGTFAFHLKMLQGLVEKDPDTGEYRLTEEGIKAYKALTILTGEEQPHEGEKHIERKEAKPEIITISDKLSFTLTKHLAEKLCKENKKIYFTDILTLIIEDMPEELLECVLEGINDVFYIQAPDHLKPLIEIKSGDIGFVGKNSGFLGSMIAGLTSSIIKGVMKGIEESIKIKSGGRTIKFNMVTDIEKASSFKIFAESSSLKIEKEQIDKLLFKGKTTPDSYTKVSTENGIVYVKAEEAEGELSIPDNKIFEEVFMDIESSSTGGDLSVREKLYLRSDSSNISLTVDKLKKSEAKIELDSSNAKIVLDYDGFKGDSNIIVKGDSSNISLEVRIPKETAINAVQENGIGTMIVEGITLGSYKDKNYDEAESRLNIIIDIDDGVYKVNVVRK
ncbi:MAG: ArsR family transcriptional regulator [Thermoprotei archaeon]|nr:MAG: ArsR family transcriptional regulator [Thermoprotei archaeon]